MEERSNQKVQTTYRTTKSFAAILFQKKTLGCQFKSGAKIHDPEARAKDIRPRQWGYPWLVELRTTADVDYVFGLLGSAYDYEQ